jgi:regulator of sigma E protease
MFAQAPSIVMLVLGFGFVIFFHELGHFLAAKWVGIRVEQFAVGFGQALLSWRKGMGLTFGSSGKKYEELSAAGQADNIGETEYRLNWIPLGGYVKMMGQDDLRPNSEQNDPRAYNKKSISARMFVVSAGVIMNIFLAAVGFMVVFLMGFRVQPPVVGSVIPGSPASQTTRTDGTPAPLSVGDRILMYDGKWQHDFTKITLNVALSGEGVVPIYVQRVDGTKERLDVRPLRAEGDSHGFLMIGVGPTPELRGIASDRLRDDPVLNSPDPLQFVPPEYLAVKPGEMITALNGQPLKAGGVDDEYWKLDRALQDGKPVTITVASADGAKRDVSVSPHFQQPFSSEPLNFLGMVPRALIREISPNSSAKGKLMPGDVVLSLTYSSDRATAVNPTVHEVRTRLEKAGQTSQPVDMKVLRNGEEKEFKGLIPNVKIGKGQYGLSVALSVDEMHPVVGDTIDKTPAHVAGIPAGSTITAINGKPVSTWFDVKQAIAEAKPGVVKIAAATPNGAKEFDLTLDPQQIASVANLHYGHSLALHDRVEPRKTSSPLTAAAWGVTETRDFVLQFYLTLHRMFQGSVSYKNMMGPVGIFNAGRQFAYKGADWLIWFLAMISANLAVVNFLPIPIVDGGLFTFLIVEKIQGRPLSAKTQSIAQFVGLAIILSVFLLVTYQDIARIAM